MNKEIELLHNKIDAQDKIINEQALEIAELREENEKLTNLWLESQTKKRNAIEYIKEHSYDYRIGGIAKVNGDKLLEILEAKDELTLI